MYLRWIACFLVAFLFWPCLRAGAQQVDGEALYKARCAVCHGKDGEPRSFAKGSPSFKDEAWQGSTSLEQIAEVVADGRKRMPAFRNKLSPEQIRAVAAYVKTLE